MTSMAVQDPPRTPGSSMTSLTSRTVQDLPDPKGSPRPSRTSRTLQDFQYLQDLSFSCRLSLLLIPHIVWLFLFQNLPALILPPSSTPPTLRFILINVHECVFGILRPFRMVTPKQLQQTHVHTRSACTWRKLPAGCRLCGATALIRNA